jgi:CheY-like chemotaxis protein
LGLVGVTCSALPLARCLPNLIDDDAISLFVAEQILREAGFAAPIHSFTNAEKALHSLVSHLPSEVPELILLDLNMPLMNGWDFLEVLQPHAAALAGRCQVYILTSSLALADTARAQDFALVSGIIHKPLDEEEVLGIQHAARQFK